MGKFNTLCMPYTVKLIRDSGKAWHIEFLNTGIGTRWIPCSTIVKYFLLPDEVDDVYEVWIKTWILAKNSIPYERNMCREELELVGSPHNSSRIQQHEHLDDEEREAMEAELDFSDEPEISSHFDRFHASR